MLELTTKGRNMDDNTLIAITVIGFFAMVAIVAWVSSR